MTKKYLLSRNLANQYIKETIPKLISLLEREVEGNEEIVYLSDKIKSIFRSVDFEKQKKDYVATIHFSRLLHAASIIASDYGIHIKDVANILLSPFLPEINLLDDSVKLLKELSNTFDNDYFSFSKMRRELNIPCELTKEKELKARQDNLVENGLIAVRGNRLKIVDTFPSPYEPTEEELEEGGEWYIDDNNTLQYGENPPYRGPLATLFESLAKAENDYQIWWAPIADENKRLMTIFEKDIASLKSQSRNNYLSDIYWFLDSYFYRETIPSIHDASENILDFFRYYICKCPGHSEYLIKRMMTTIKRFFTVMYKNKEVTKEECDKVITSMKDNCDWLIEAATDYEKRVEYFGW